MYSSGGLIQFVKNQCQDSGERLAGVSYECPYYNTVLSVEIDAVAYDLIQQRLAMAKSLNVPRNHMSPRLRSNFL
jgi:hypothetical protein